jgi:hypothetical protein
MRASRATIHPAGKRASFSSLALVGTTVVLLLLLASFSPQALAAPLQATNSAHSLLTAACDPGDNLNRHQSTCSSTPTDADNAGFTGFCVGASALPCTLIAGFFLSWSTQFIVMTALAGTLWAFTGLFQGTGFSHERGAAASWTSLIVRLKGTMQVCFVFWRLGALLQLVESIWGSHTSEGTTNSQGVPLPPTSFLHDGYVVLFLVLLQLAIFWISLHMVVASLVGVAAYGGFSRRTLGEVLKEQGLWIALLFVALALPKFLSVFFGIDFS